MTTLLAGLVGCTDADPETDPTEAPDAAASDAGPDVGPAPDAAPDAAPMPDMAPDAAPPGLAVEWTECDLLSEPRPGDPAIAAECAEVDLPLDHAAPDGDTVTVWVKRLRAAGASRGQLWMLQGGPGGSSIVFERSMPDYTRRFGLDVYITDARGAGLSSRWSCPEAESPDGEGGVVLTEAEVPVCLDELRAQWGAEGLAHFGTTAAARDVLALVEATAAPDDAVFVYGVSYGTYWVNRILQLAPERFAGAVLDSIVDASAPDLNRIDAWHHTVGEQLMNACGEDPLCAEKLGDDPWAEVGALLDAIDGGHCADLFAEEADGRGLMRQLMGVMVSSLVLRSSIPALVYRLRRCDPADQAAVVHLFDLLFAGDGPPPLSNQLFSRLLSMHVTFSELWGDMPLDEAGLRAQAEAAWMSKDIGLAFGPFAADWPTYAVDDRHGRWAQTDTPLLMLNGTWDPQTPIDRALAAAEAFAGAHQTFVTLPAVTHGVLGQSNVRGNLPTCGVQLMEQFVLDPTAALDTACVDQLEQRIFALPPAYADLLFGTDDLYENLPE